MAQSERLSGEALARLLESRQQFLSFLERRVENRAAAEDILQAAFLRGLERGGEVRDDESVVAWFYRLLRNAVIDHYRKRDTAARATETLGAEWVGHEEPDDLARGEICQCVLGLLDGLKPEYREALRLVEVEDRSLADLAAQASISANNAAVRVHRAREALRKQVTSACGVCATHGCVDCRCRKKK
jgi:RNA polymerase sigma-70 factor (ECF subfamily)